MSKNPREMTIRVMELMDDGVLDARTIADTALNALSEAEVVEMVQRNDIMPWWEDDEDDEDDDD